MKKILVASVLSFGLLTSLSAYELNGDLKVQWTGFKTAKKLGVSGTFKKVNLTIKKDDNFVNFLKSANVEIDALSLDSKLPFRDKNITSTLFSLASAKNIKGAISNVDEESKKLTLDLTLNEVTKPVEMTYEVVNNTVVAKGTIDVIDYSLNDSYSAFTKKCAGLHAGKSYSEVAIEFTLPYK